MEKFEEIGRGGALVLAPRLFWKHSQVLAKTEKGKKKESLGQIRRLTPMKYEATIAPEMFLSKRGDRERG